MSGLRPFWRYYGGKWRMAPRYPRPLHDTIIEPFAGVAGYSLRYPERKVVLVEKYAVIAEIWRYLIGVSAAEVLRIPLVENLADLPGWVPQPARDLVGFNLADGSWQPRQRASPCVLQSLRGRPDNANSPNHARGWSIAMRARVAGQLAAIRHWRVIEGDYTAAPTSRATYFVDPPYERAGRHYKHPSTAIDFAALGAWCRTRPGQVIACEADGATWLPFRPFGPERHTAINRSRSREAIWTNTPETQLKLWSAA